MLDIVTENKNYSEESIISFISAHGIGEPGKFHTKAGCIIRYLTI